MLLCADAKVQCKGPPRCARAHPLIVEGAAVALCTPSEIVKMGMTTKYNLARLKQYLVGAAFDPSGSPKAHLLCLMPKLGVGRDFLTSCHKAACLLANVKFEKVTKAQFVMMGLGEDDAIRPEDSLGSYIEYLKSLSR